MQQQIIESHHHAALILAQVSGALSAIHSYEIGQPLEAGDVQAEPGYA